ncbi:MAG: DUF3520 domain-containing protein [Flammeovirgaceae bacterium]|nr:DUF3520 domain-containing protein [Flammeovirgaceae bacterium]
MESEFSKIDDLKYQKAKVEIASSASKEILTVKFRYKKPDDDVSKLIVHPLIDNSIALNRTSENFRWSAAVAAFGMQLRDSEYVKDFTYQDVLQLAQNARGKDSEGYRIEFINMVKSLNAMPIR